LDENNAIGLISLTKDLEQELDTYLKFFILLYADDTVILAESSGEEKGGKILCLTNTIITIEIIRYFTIIDNSRFNVLIHIINYIVHFTIYIVN
jgi:hypothetical protein